MKTLFGLLLLSLVPSSFAAELGKEIVCTVVAYDQPSQSYKLMAPEIVIPSMQQFDDIPNTKFTLKTDDGSVDRVFGISYIASQYRFYVMVFDDTSGQIPRKLITEAATGQSENFWLSLDINRNDPIEPTFRIDCVTRAQTAESARQAKLRQDNSEVYSLYGAITMFAVYDVKGECEQNTQYLPKITEDLVAFIRAEEFDARIKKAADDLEAAYKSIQELCTAENIALPEAGQKTVLAEMRKRRRAAQEIAFSITHPGESWWSRPAEK